MASLYLITCALALGQTLERTDWQLTPQYPEGMELIYKGTCVEESLVPGVQYQRQYALETVFFVQNVGQRQAEIVLQTGVYLQQSRKDVAPLPGSIRMELLKIDRVGRLTAEVGAHLSLALPLDGPAPLETGIFVELPGVPINKQSYWEEFEEGRPLRGWRILGAEQRNGASCVKLQGIQQAPEWTKPRGDNIAWRRQDIIWFAPQLGVVVRADRIVERREPAHTEPTQRITVSYELDSRLIYSGALVADRRQEIVKIHKFQEEAAPMVRDPASNREKIVGLSRRLAGYLAETPPTPYHKYLAQLQGRVERARKGEAAVEVGADDSAMSAGPIGMGKKVPEFIVADLISQKSRRFYELLDGQPVFLFYYSPTEETGKKALRFAQKLFEEQGNKVLILGMAVSDDTELIRRQHEEMELSFLVLDGRAMHRTFGVDGTPRLILLDGDGRVHYAFTGWGYHTAGELNREIRKLLGK